MNAAPSPWFLRRWLRVGVLVLVLCGCGSDLDVGSDVLWATDLETGDLSDWYGPPTPGGGLFPDPSNSPPPTPVSSPTHSGRYSLKFTDLAKSDLTGPGVYRELVAPPDAYYSVWYFIPRLYETHSQWTILKFRSRSDEDMDVINHGHDLNLRTLPGGQVVLYVFSHDPEYLQAPLADPPAFVPVETWFQIEVLYRPRTDDTGKILVWLDDRLVYDLENRRTSGSTDVFWTPCDVAEDVVPFGQPGTMDGAAGAGGASGADGADNADSAAGASATSAATESGPELYIDDAAISLKRVTREGKILIRR
jgi:hypothetical protein